MSSRPNPTAANPPEPCVDVIFLALLYKALHELRYLKCVSSSFANAARRVVHAREWLWGPDSSHNCEEMASLLRKAPLSLPLRLVKVGDHFSKSSMLEMRVFPVPYGATATLHRLVIEKRTIPHLKLESLDEDDDSDSEFDFPPTQDVLNIHGAELEVDGFGIFENPGQVAGYKECKTIYCPRVQTCGGINVSLSKYFPYDPMLCDFDMARGLGSWAIVPEDCTVEYLATLQTEMSLGDALLSGRIPSGVKSVTRD